MEEESKLQLPPVQKPSTDILLRTIKKIASLSDVLEDENILKSASRIKGALLDDVNNGLKIWDIKIIIKPRTSELQQKT
jgi:hypothetical protein